MELIDEVSPLARRAGAVNVVVNRHGRLSGDNTDVYGFATSLEAACPDARSRPALILGAGGAARAVVLALEAMDVARVTVANRNPARAEQLAADLAPISLRLVALDEPTMRQELERTALLINATSLGWHAGETPLPLDLLPLLAPNCFVIDLTYRDTDLLLAARTRGLRTLDGLAMLVHQGARALELWTGQEAPLAVMLEAASRARDARATPAVSTTSEDA
jgi:shikimate dehydrogenase